MKIICAFDSFKGCMSALEASQAAASGLLQGHPEAAVIPMPLSDGGEGLVDCIARAIEVQWVEADVHDPLMRPLRVRYAPDFDTFQPPHSNPI